MKNKKYLIRYEGSGIMRVMIRIQGTVQGVGFRPFIYRLANELGLNGFVQNSTSGVTIEAEGLKPVLDFFIMRIRIDKPELSTIYSFDYNFLDDIGYETFKIMESIKSGNISAIILPDIAICSDCLNEMNDTNDRRYQYPFINCTNCGPRYSIIESLPYDRPNISMKSFRMCKECESEYENPNDRRYHAQPIACPVCGPHAELWDSNGNVVAINHNAITETCNLIHSGKIIALKGIGGFQLLVDAANTGSIQELRKRKQREEKPFAIMCPDLETAKLLCEISEIEEFLINSTESPIVLLKKKNGTKSLISDEIAPDNPYLGVMLPYSPIHHLLLNQLKIPVIATSGNISEEPMCIDEFEALSRLGGIADYFLVHNRPIIRQVDDSIARIIAGRKSIIRRARGYTPLPVNTEKINSINRNILAVGAHLKNSIALLKFDPETDQGHNILISQHIGDLSTNEATTAFTNAIKDFKKLYEAEEIDVICDLHPDYFSTKYAVNNFENILQVQHHSAHILSCRLENRVNGISLGVAWDGTGYGLDGTIWGGEFFISDDNSCRHIAQFRQFPLPGGEKAISEPRRSAVGILYEIFGINLFDSHNAKFIRDFSNEECSLLNQMLTKMINCPRTSSVGRIFDAVASLLDLKQKSAFEGQSAMAVEFIADINQESTYEFKIIKDKLVIIDWEPMIIGLLSDIANNVSKRIIAGKFHNFLVDIIIYLTEYLNLEKVILSGGCFQNILLTEKIIKRLEENGKMVYWHQLVPTNDGGIALGQIGYYLMQEKISHSL